VVELEDMLRKCEVVDRERKVFVEDPGAMIPNEERLLKEWSKRTRA
jgi:hypothetical protein